MNESIQRHEFRCDDRAGFALNVLRAGDGDFHLSVVPIREDFEHPDEVSIFAACYSASVRVRMPMVGGGSHPALYKALLSLWRAAGHVEPSIAARPAPAARPVVSEEMEQQAFRIATALDDAGLIAKQPHNRFEVSRKIIARALTASSSATEGT